MSKIRLAKETAPASAPTDKIYIYVDSADGLVKQIDENGTVKILTNTGDGGYTNLTEFVDQTAYRLF